MTTLKLRNKTKIILVAMTLMAITGTVIAFKTPSTTVHSGSAKALSDAYKGFYHKIIKDNSSLAAKKYFYFNIWETRCVPCVKEMPYLDSLANKLSSDVQCVFLTAQDDELVKQFLKVKNIETKHFLIQNDAENFIEEIYTNQNYIKMKIYPLHVIMDNTGKIIYSRFGASVLANGDILLVQQFKKLGLL